MKTARKLIGFLILLLIALPVLFGVIWAVGLTQAFTSPEVISELPQNIARSVPQLIDDAVAAAADPGSDMDANARAWLLAVRQSGQKPREVLEKAGFIKWIEVELAGTLNKVSDVLRGKRHPEFVSLDFRPLKQAFNHEAIDQFFAAVVEKLPACDAAGRERWQRALRWRSGLDLEDLPACRPDPDMAKLVLQQSRAELDREIPDETHLFENGEEFPRHVNLVEMAVTFTYLLFLIPAGFILIGALIASGDRREFFRWSGGFILIGGLLAIATVFLSYRFSDWVVGGFPPHFWERITWAEDVLYHRLGSHVHDWLRPIFTPVKDVAEVVAVVGLLIFALSFVIGPPRRRQEAAPQPPAVQPPQNPGQS